MSEELFYAERREDKWIAENIPLPEKGFYVDVGCGHPFTTSQTAFLRDRKWEGLAIDASHVWKLFWVGIPAFDQVLISSSPEVMFFQDYEVPYRSRIGEGLSGARKCRTETIEHCLSRHEIGKIDFMSVDIEGQEYDLLTHLDFQLHKPSIMVIEYDTADIGQDLRIEPYMTDVKGYRVRYKTAMNIVFTP